jgi:hypothetical protein
MEKVTVDKRRQVWKKVLGDGTVESVYSSHSCEEEKLYFCASHFVCNPTTSWKGLVSLLYVHYGEMAAAKEAKAFIQQKGGWFIHNYYSHFIFTSHGVK